MDGEMVEPDRTIMIISIIGLVVIWGSFFYHKIVQGGGRPAEDADLHEGGLSQSEGVSEKEPLASKGKNRKGKR